MPGNYYGRRMGRRRPSNLRPINSMKNVVSVVDSASIGSVAARKIADAQDSATLAVAKDVERGCHIKAIWLELWAGTNETKVIGTTQQFDAYIWKNPGNNLVRPDPGTVGTSNEKKFIFKIWKGLVGARTEGTPYYFWKGWIKIPRIYQRMGSNDNFEFVFEFNGAGGLVCQNWVYKWYK